MNAILTAEQLLANLQQMPSTEREKFFLLLSAKAFGDAETLSHDELFGHLRDEEFTATEAAEYLEISIATFRRHVRSGKIAASSVVGNTHLYRLAALRELKKNRSQPGHAGL
jgi:excisionase family DNA binding protein